MFFFVEHTTMFEISRPAVSRVVKEVFATLVHSLRTWINLIDCAYRLL